MTDMRPDSEAAAAMPEVRRVTTELGTCEFCDGTVFGTFIAIISGVSLCDWCRERPADVLATYPDAGLAFNAEGTSWVCACGLTYQRPTWLDERILAAVPSVSAAMARWHLSGEPMTDSAGAPLM